jgi:ribosomal-protein-alanine N-acetyltransferase
MGQPVLVLTQLERDVLFHPLPRLETERLILEPVRSAHAAELFQVYTAPGVAEASDEVPLASVDAMQKHIGGLLREHEARTAMNWAIVFKAEGLVVGKAAVHEISWMNRRGELGFLLDPRFWRRGVMTEAVLAIIEFCFERLRFIKLCAQNTTGNAACHQLLLSLGFCQEALLREHGFWNGKAHDVRQYALFVERCAK